LSLEDQVVVARIRNPDASGDLELLVEVVCNTTDETINANIKTNAARDEVQWLGFSPEHDRVAVVVGGGPSAADHLDDIARLKRDGATIIALNAASIWLRGHGIVPDIQCMIDARPENMGLLDRQAPLHLLASQVHPALVDAVGRPILMHLMTPLVEDQLPAERRERGDYALLGGGFGVGNTAICAAYVMGYRTLHCFGFDSSHRSGASHAYDQPLNAGDPLIDTEWAGVCYTSSLAMRAHAERFQVIARSLQGMGCVVHVHGDGLLPAMFNTPVGDLSERDKYRLMWQFESYRTVAPGERLVDLFCDVARPGGLILDFGCGTGRGALALSRRGHTVSLLDFASNCRDPDAMLLPFMEHDLTQPCPVSGQYGFCTDVMEHIPPADTRKVLGHMFSASPRIFFSIGTAPDDCGALIGHTLHMEVRPHAWWRALLSEYGRVVFERDEPGQSIFYVERA